jgi:hypothetical protein
VLPGSRRRRAYSGASGSVCSGCRWWPNGEVSRACKICRSWLGRCRFPYKTDQAHREPSPDQDSHRRRDWKAQAGTIWHLRGAWYAADMQVLHEEHFIHGKIDWSWSSAFPDVNQGLVLVLLVLDHPQHTRHAFLWSRK